MIKLYGLALSNYYNVIKLAMLEKDLAMVNTAVLASRVAQKLGQPDPVMEIPGMTEYLERMEQRPHLKTVRADSIASLNSFLNR